MSNKKIRIIFWGTPEFVVPVLQMLEANFTVVGVVTQPDQKVGRKQALTPSAVKAAAGSVILTPEKLNEDFAQILKDLQPNLFIVAAYGKIIPQYILDIPKYGALNIHPSLLPKYCGPSPIQSAILNGDKITGISIIKMDEKMDHGPLVYAEEFSISSLDNFQTLSTNMFLRATEILAKIIPEFISGKLKPKPQNHQMATFCKIIKKEDGYFDIDNPPSSEKLDRMIRAYYPWPNVWCKWSPSRHPERSAKDLKIVKFYPGNIIQMEGKKAAKLEDFLRGYPNFPSCILYR